MPTSIEGRNTPNERFAIDAEFNALEAKPKAAASAPDGPYEALSADDKSALTRVLVNFGKALQAYMRKLESKNSPFDKYVAAGLRGDDLTPSQKSGLRLFIDKAGCVKCNAGTHFSFTDEQSQFRNTGLKQVNPADAPAQPAEDRRQGSLHGRKEAVCGWYQRCQGTF
ncbi:MAG: hypothetical protein L0Y66_05040 [Myxococcaceae bacterium]|nr:hypothetical protein [Myxococcaceae bacterium]MCI0671716.1 hypothetical protein [Myxococcaceae bacterium]